MQVGFRRYFEEGFLWKLFQGNLKADTALCHTSVGPGVADFNNFLQSARFSHQGFQSWRLRLARKAKLQIQKPRSCILLELYWDNGKENGNYFINCISTSERVSASAASGLRRFLL